MKTNFPNGISCDCEGHFATDYSNSSGAKIIPYTIHELRYTATVNKGAKNASIEIRYNIKPNDWAKRDWKNYKGFTIKILSHSSNNVNFTIYETDTNNSNENGINYTLAMTTTSITKNGYGYKRLGYVFTDNTNNTVVERNDNYVEIPDLQGGISDYTRSSLLSNILKNKLAKDLRSDLEAPQGGKKVWYIIPGTNSKNTYVDSNGNLNWELFSNYLNNKLNSLNLGNTYVFSNSSNSLFIEAWWQGCNKNQIYRTELYAAKQDTGSASAGVNKTRVECSNTGGYNSDGSLKNMPYYKITDAKWTVTEGNSTLGTITMSYKGNNTFTLSNAI